MKEVYVCVCACVRIFACVTMGGASELAASVTGGIARKFAEDLTCHVHLQVKFICKNPVRNRRIVEEVAEFHTCAITYPISGGVAPKWLVIVITKVLSFFHSPM